MRVTLPVSYHWCDWCMWRCILRRQNCNWKNVHCSTRLYYDISSKADCGDIFIVHDQKSSYRTPLRVRYKICCVKTWRLFSSSRNPCWTCVTNSNVLLCHREKLPDRRRHVHKWWHNERDTSWESLQFNAAVTFSRKADESQINQMDWLI